MRFDDIMDALKRLDGEVAEKPEYGKFINRARRWKDLYRGRSRRPLPVRMRRAMTKHLMAIVLATGLARRRRQARAFCKRPTGKGPGSNAYLPVPHPAVPWLDLDPRTKWPKGDLPIGREPGPLVLRPVAPDPQVSANVPSDFRRM